MPDTSYPPGKKLLQHPDLALEVLPRFQWWELGGRDAGARLTGLTGIDRAPQTGELVSAGNIVVLGDGPGRWLIRRPREADPLTAPAGCALIDLSDSLWGIRARGALAAELLCCGCPLDPGNPDNQPPAAARSQFHHLPLLVLHARAGNLDLLVPRSYRTDFVHALLAASRDLLTLASPECRP